MHLAHSCFYINKDTIKMLRKTGTILIQLDALMSTDCSDIFGIMHETGNAFVRDFVV